MIRYSDIISPPTVAAIKTGFVRLLSAAGFPVASWADTSLPKITLEFESQQAADCHATVAGIGKIAVLTEETKGTSLDLHGQNYQEDRNPAVASERSITLINSLGSMRSWATGTLVITSTSTKAVYRNVAQITLPAASSSPGSAAATFRNDMAGVDGTPAASLVIGTPAPGVTISASYDFLVLGANEESDADFAKRLRLKWPSLANSGPAGAYESWALDSHKAAGITKEVTRVNVVSNTAASGANINYPDVIVYVSSASGNISTQAVTAARAAIEARHPLGIRVHTTYATRRTIAIGGVVYVSPSFRESAELAIRKALDDMFGALPIGGTVHHSEVIGQIQRVAGVGYAEVKDMSTGAFLNAGGKWELATNQVPVVVNSISYQTT